MAGNRRPYGLKPKQLGATTEGWPNRDLKDWQISEAIIRRMRDTRTEDDVRPFLACIGGVYSQKASARSEFRAAMHPRFVKAVAREVKHSAGDKQKRLESAVEKIAAKIAACAAEDQAAQRDAEDPSAQRDWVEKFPLNVGAYKDAIKDDITSDTERIALTSSYLLASVWRDLKLKERLQGKPSKADQRQELNDISAALKQIPPPLSNVSLPLDDYIETQSQPYGRESSCIDQDLSPGDTARFQREAVDDLIDALRERQEGLLELLRTPLRSLAPIKRYLDIETPLASSQNQKYFRQLAHSVQIWMLGAWMLEQKLEGGETLRDHILDLMYNYFDDFATGIPTLSLREKWGDRGPQLVDLFWGLIAATHDIARPLQSFKDWSKDFFIKYFDEPTVTSFDFLPARLDLFHHPRFPFYKRAITNFYGSRERNWLESVFHLGLSRRIDHALAGSLILMREIEPDDGYGGDMYSQNEIWTKATYDLKILSENDHPELGLVVPAYISHAVAFSHLKDMRWHYLKWIKTHQRNNQVTSRRSVPAYFVTTAENFRVTFSKFPLTYLIALCEVLLDGEEEAWMVQMANRLPVRMEPPNQNCTSSVSPFYVSDVRFTEGKLILDLCLSQNGLENEGKIECYGNELVNLITDFRNPRITRDPRITEWVWVVYDAARYQEKTPKWKKEKTLNYKGFKGWCDVTVNGDAQRRFSRPTYDILMMYLRLQEFTKSYVCDGIKFAVCFQNVAVDRDPNSKFLFNLESREP